MTMRLEQERAWRANLDPMGRYYARHQHLLLGSTSITVTRAPETPPPDPEPAVASPAESEAPPAPESTDAAPTPDPTRYMARVFRRAAIDEARELLGTSAGKADSKREAAALARSSAALDRAIRDAGWRSLPWAGPEANADPFGGLGPELENFREVIEHLRTAWTLARRARCAAEARIDPILLLGPPGVGKSHFAADLADLIGVNMSVFSAGGAQDAMQLCGSDARWSNCRTGMVFDALAGGDSAAPVLVVDELDKFAQESTGSRDTPVNILLDLLEPDSARRYRDMSLQLEMDASRMIVVCTANEREHITAPLLSRLTEFRVAAPSAEQRRCLLEGYLAQLIKSHECPAGIGLDAASAEAALVAPDLDVRALLRLARFGFAEALAAESDRIILAPPRRVPTRQRIGFI
jgi:ATP-dependent Lon protease